MTDDARHFDSMGNEIDPDDLGEPVTEEQATASFDQTLAAWRDIATGFAEPLDGETLPLLNTGNLPIANDALRQCPEMVHGLASIGILFAADYLRVHGPKAFPLLPA